MPIKRRSKPLKQKPAFKQLKKLIDQPGPKDLLWYFRAGKEVERLCPDREYGESKIESLVKALGQPNSFTQKLWNARKIVRKYDIARVKQLNRSVQGSKYRLTLSHITHLLSITEPAVRSEFEDDCVREKWSTKELASRIQRYQGQKGHGGRKYQKPAALEDGLRQLIKVSTDWQRRFQRVWFHPDQPAIDLGSKRASTGEVAELCGEAVGVLESIQAGIKRRLPELRSHAGVKKKTGRKRKGK